MNKLFKVAGILGGAFVFSEICGIIGETQAFIAMSGMDSDVVEEMLEYMGDEEIIGEFGVYAKTKIKVVKWLTELLIENDFPN